MKKQNRRNLLLILLITLMLSIIAAGVFYIVQSGGYINGGSEEQSEEAAEPEEPSVSTDTLFLFSDYQQEDGWKDPSDTLSGVLQAVKKDGKKPTNTICCGDYTNDRKLHDYQLSPDSSVEEIREIIGRECPDIPQDGMIFTQGNHDQMTDQLNKTGLYEYDNYLVYVLDTQYDFPWKQGRSTDFRDYVTNAAAEMRSCFNKLIMKGETRPVFIAGHVPLQFTARTSSRHNTGDNMYSSYIFDVVNEAGEALDIVYLFGHDHSKGWDCYLGGSCVFKQPGDTILIPDAGYNTVSTDEYTEEKLNFTYMNAGYVGYYMNCGPDELDAGTAGSYSAADETLTGTVCEITPDELIITRYSEDGVHVLGAEGEGDPYKGGIDAGLIGPEHYSKKTESPAHIKRLHADADDDSPVSDIDYLILVDKNHLLPDDWESKVQLVSTVNSVGDEVRAEKLAYKQYLKLKAELEEEGIFVELDSAFRSVEEQQEIIDDFTEKYGSDYAHTYAAEPGTSEHHTGLALDLYLIVDGVTVYENEDLVQYPEIWAKIHEKLPKYGFILRYPKNGKSGYPYEEWHIRYVGKKAAKEMTEQGLTFEEYVR